MKYYVPETLDLHDMDPSDYYDLGLRITRHNWLTAAIAAEQYYCNHDGHELSWPIEIVLVSEDGITSAWTADVEFRPTFCAHRKQQQ